MAGFYDRAARFYDFFIWGAEKRYAGLKRDAFAEAKGKTLLVGAGTGIDFPLLPPELDLVAIDLSREMLKKAESKASRYPGSVSLLQADIENTNFPDGYFDTVLTSCVFCSVRDPVKGLKEIRRIIKPGGKLIMFEHVLSKNLLLKPMLYLMDLLLPGGPSFTRDTVRNVRAAGFKIIKERNLYMDIVKNIVAERENPIQEAEK